MLRPLQLPLPRLPPLVAKTTMPLRPPHQLLPPLRLRLPAWANKHPSKCCMSYRESVSPLILLHHHLHIH
jgi:hypothetical protein